MRERTSAVINPVAVKEQLELQGMRVRTLIRRSKLSRSTVRRILDGYTGLSRDVTIRGLCAALGLTREQLLMPTEAPWQEPDKPKPIPAPPVAPEPPPDVGLDIEALGEYGLPPAVAKACVDESNFALGTRHGQVFFFGSARLDERFPMWVKLLDIDSIHPATSGLRFSRGIDIRITDIIWATAAPYGS